MSEWMRGFNRVLQGRGGRGGGYLVQGLQEQVELGGLRLRNRGAPVRTVTWLRNQGSHVIVEMSPSVVRVENRRRGGPSGLHKVGRAKKRGEVSLLHLLSLLRLLFQTTETCAGGHFGTRWCRLSEGGGREGVGRLLGIAHGAAAAVQA